jgi:hypothetical protein
LTVCLKTNDVLAKAVALPLYDTVMECTPVLSNDVVNIALPLISGNVPNEVAPSFSVTKPVGMPLPGASASTPTVNVTAWPSVEGSSEETKMVLVAFLLTVCVNAEEALVR